MKHLMTHKFIFGLLMAVVLALGVQGTADAIGTLTPSFTPAELSTLATGATITVGGLSATPDLDTVRESILVGIY